MEDAKFRTLICDGGKRVQRGVSNIFECYLLSLQRAAAPGPASAATAASCGVKAAGDAKEAATTDQPSPRSVLASPAGLSRSQFHLCAGNCTAT